MKYFISICLVVFCIPSCSAVGDAINTINGHDVKAIMLAYEAYSQDNGFITDMIELKFDIEKSSKEIIVKISYIKPRLGGGAEFIIELPNSYIKSKKYGE